MSKTKKRKLEKQINDIVGNDISTERIIKNRAKLMSLLIHYDNSWRK